MRFCLVQDHGQVALRRSHPTRRSTVASMHAPPPGSRASTGCRRRLGASSRSATASAPSRCIGHPRRRDPPRRRRSGASGLPGPPAWDDPAIRSGGEGGQGAQDRFKGWIGRWAAPAPIANPFCAPASGAMGHPLPKTEVGPTTSAFTRSGNSFGTVRKNPTGLQERT